LSTILYIAAFFAFAVGVAHSYLGERKILDPLIKRGNLPKIRGSEKTTARTIRIAWHVTTILFWVVGVVLIFLARNALNFQSMSAILAGTFLPLGVLSLIASRGRHVSWLPFLIIGGACLYAATT
jgi:hypothetical protein